MNRLPNADLHCHSTVSGGTLTPEDVARRAKAQGVTLWSLTDHDEVGGQRRAISAAHAVGLDVVAGCEISVTFADVTVHIVRLGVDVEDEQLVRGFAATRDGRVARAQEMGEALARLVIPAAYEGALRYVTNPDLISRTHFARFLVETGACANTGEVFRRYLGEGGPAFGKRFFGFLFRCSAIARYTLRMRLWFHECPRFLR